MQIHNTENMYFVVVIHVTRANNRYTTYNTHVIYFFTMFNYTNI